VTFAINPERARRRHHPKFQFDIADGLLLDVEKDGATIGVNAGNCAVAADRIELVGRPGASDELLLQ
jgi:hypothetical protein